MRMLIVLALLIYPGSEAIAQERAPELGFGLTGLSISFTGGENRVQFEVNQQFLSLGLYTSPTVAVEPSAAITLASGGGATIAILGLGVAVPIHTQPTWGREGLFFAPGAAVTIISADASGVGETASQFSVGMDVGTKIPVVDAVSVKLAGGFDYGFETDTFDDGITLSGKLGLSVFFP